MPVLYNRGFAHLTTAELLRRTLAVEGERTHGCRTVSRYGMRGVSVGNHPRGATG